MGFPSLHSFRLAGLILISTVALPQSSLYEEDLLASAPIRVEQWKQMAAYAASLPQKSFPSPPGPPADRQTLARDFRQAIGYPAPGFSQNPTGHFDKAGEDSVATYYRCFIRVTPQMAT